MLLEGTHSVLSERERAKDQHLGVFVGILG